MENVMENKGASITEEMHKLAEKISELPESTRAKVDAFLTGYLTAMETIINRESA